MYVTGPADITYSTKSGHATRRLDIYNAYLFLPDQASGVRLEGVAEPGKALERDARAELSPIPRDPPVKVPVTILVDDCELRARKNAGKRNSANASTRPRASSRRPVVFAWNSRALPPGNPTPRRRTCPNC